MFDDMYYIQGKVYMKLESIKINTLYTILLHLRQQQLDQAEPPTTFPDIHLQIRSPNLIKGFG